MADGSMSLNSQLRTLVKNTLTSSLHGKKIYLLGSSEYGPTNEPIRIKSTVGLYNKFGKEGSLINAFHEIKYTTKNNSVYLVKTTGKHSTAYLNVNILDGEIISNSFILTSSESNEIFNDIYVEIDINSLTIVYPSDLNIPENRITYSFDEYKTIGLLANAINLDVKHKKGYVNANYSIDSNTITKDAFYVCNPDIVYLYGGSCGLGYTKNLLYSCLEDTYSMLESYPVDIIVPVDAFLDDIYPDDSENEEYQYNMKYYQTTKDYLTPDTFGNPRSFMNQLINFCINQLNFGFVTTGIIGFNPINSYTTDYLYESDELADMFKHCLVYNRDICENKNYSFLVSAVAGDIGYNKNTIIDNGYLAYAAFNASIEINSGNTNIPISDNLRIYNEFSEEVLADLAEEGIVTFRHSPLFNTVVVYDGITAIERKESPLRLYCNVRMTQLCISYINEILQFFIGLDFIQLMDNNTIENSINEILNILVSKNVINEYSTELVPDYSNGTLTVNLDILTNYMTKSVRISSVVNINSEEI